MHDSLSDIKVSKQHAKRPPPIELGINVEKPKFPQYAVYSKRLESFDKWPEYLSVGKKDMIEAGLVYTGVGDSVRCYFCGGGLRNWEVGDVPMEEHAKWYPKCPHVLLVKGQEYIEKVSRGEKPDIVGDGESVVNSKQQDVHDIDNCLETVAAQSCIEMGYSREMVAKAIQIYINKNGKKDFKGKDLCEILFDIEENPENVNIFNKVDGTEVEEISENDKEALQQEEELEPLESLLEENQRLKENQMCKICLDSRADVIFLPCGHMVSCPQCAPALTKCPICRKAINGHIKAFFAVISNGSSSSRLI